MKYFFTILILLIFIASTFSQEQNLPSFNNEIKSVVSDSSSIYYYPKLLKKVNQQPSELKITEIYYLYYGQIFQPDYNVFGYLMDNNQAVFRRAVMSYNYKKAISSGIKIISKFPVDLTTLLHLNICMEKKNVPDSTYFVNLRYHLLMEAILSTGNGKSKDLAIKVINIEDESVIKGAIGFLGGKTYIESTPNHAYDVWEVDNKKLYFELIINDK